MLALLLSSLLSLFFFAVFGTALLKMMRLPGNFTEKLLIGMATGNTITTVISLFLPLNGYVLLTLLIISFGLAVLVRRDLAAMFQQVKSKLNILLFCLPFIIIAFIIALNVPYNYDSGLYHIQAIKWIETYRAVRGLAHLQGRFGFNPNIFTWLAFTSLYDLFHQEIFSVNFTVFAILTGYFVNRLYTLSHEKRSLNLFLFYALAFVAIIFLFDNLSSPSPDYLSAALPLFILVRVIDINRHPQPAQLDFGAIVILCAYVFTVKISAVALLLLVLFVLYNYRQRAKIFTRIVIISALIMLPWLVRNVILTGWVIFPFPSLNLFNFDWQLPLSKVIHEKNAIVYWARVPGPNYLKIAPLGIKNWVPVWWGRQTFFNRLFFICSLLCPVLIFVLQIVKRYNIGLFKNAVVLTAFAGVLVWFFAAPEFRFGRAFITIAALSPLLILNFDKRVIAASHLIFFTTLLFLFAVQVFIGRSMLANAYRQVASVLIKPPLMQGPDNLTFKVYKFKGVAVYKPMYGDQCFCHVIPCEPNLDTTFTLRDSDLVDGFVLKRK